jgi:hypothetical protein
MHKDDQMMRGIIQLFLSVAACLLTICSAQVASNDAGLFQGNFTGMATGDVETSAPLTLNLTQNGSWVAGSVTILPGISINTGGLICPGTVAVPSGTMGINGSISNKNPHQLAAKSVLIASGMKITADMLADISKDGNTMKAQINLNMPWPCRDPTIRADLVRSNS